MSLSVLHVSQPVDGGVARSIGDLVSDQVGRGWEVAVASPDGPLPARVTEAGARHLGWRVARPPGPATLLETAGLRRIVKRATPEIVHLHTSKAGLAGRLAIRGRLPTLFQPHAWSFHALDGALRRAALTWEQLAARWTTVIVCVSRAERTDGARAGISADWRVVPNGIDLDAFSDGDRDAARTRGQVLRYRARVTKQAIEVGLVAVATTDALGALNGTDNQFSFTTTRYRTQPLVITGPGAGPAVTAAGVYNDLLRLAERGGR